MIPSDAQPCPLPCWIRFDYGFILLVGSSRVGGDGSGRMWCSSTAASAPASEASDVRGHVRPWKSIRQTSECDSGGRCSELLRFFSRKHGEGFFRWVHLNCSHESHYKVSMQGIIIMKVNARSHCKESLQGVIARSHCKESLQGVIARSHCKESWQGLQLALDSLHLQLALDSLHLQLDSMHLQLALDSMHLAPCTWLLALGSLHLAPCTCNLHLTPCTCDLHLTPCTWLLATCNGSHDSLQ